METGHVFVIADDHPLFRGAVRLALEGMAAASEIHECGTIDEAKAFIGARGDIDLMLLDLAMPGVSGLSGLVILKAMRPELPVVVVTASEDVDTMRRALELGASGFIPKSASMDAMRDAISTVMDGGIATPANLVLGFESDPETRDLIDRLKMLTPQQTRVLGMLAEGLLNKQIAYDLGVSEATVKAHVSAILQKLNVDSRTQAVIRLSRIGAEALSAGA